MTGAFTRSGGTFTPNGGTVSFSTSAATIDLGGALSFNHVTFLSGNKTIAAGTTLTANGNLTHTAGTLTVNGALAVDGNLTLTAGSMNAGTVSARGAISQASTYGGGTATLRIDGTADQTFTGAATPTAGALPNLVIAKPFGTLTLAGTLRTARNWAYTSGGLAAADSSVVFNGNLTISGSHTLDDVELRSGTVTIAAGTTLTVPGTLTMTAGGLATGTLAAQGDITVGAGYTGGGTATLRIDGTADQTFTGAATPTAGALPNLVIAKPFGTLTLAGTLRTARNWTYTSGGLAAAGSTVVFNGNLTISGSHTLDDVELRSGTVTIAAGTTLTVPGTLTMTNGNLNGGTLDALGDVFLAGTFDGETGTLRIVGAGNQTLTGTATTTTGDAPNIVIDKPSGALTLVGAIRISTAAWTYAAGSLNPGTSHLVFEGGVTISGSHALYDVTILGTVTIAGGATLTIAGTLGLELGRLDAGSGVVTIGSDGTVVRTAAHVVGAMRKPMTAGPGVVVTFEIGDATAYTPVTLNFGILTGSGAIVASSLPGDHPDLAASDIDPAASVNRHWRLLNEGATFNALDLTLTFVAADLDPGARTDRFVAGKRDATWSDPSIGAALPTSITAVGITSLSEFAVGEPAPTVVTPTPTPLPTSTPAAPELPNTIGRPGSGGGSPAPPWLLLGAMTILVVANVAARRQPQRR